MQTTLGPAELANAVTGFAVIFSGVLTLLLTYLVAPQPARWRWAYVGVIITGVPTVWFHGFGEEFWPRVWDVGTNFLLGWLMTVAALGDYYSRRTQLIAGGVSLIVNVAATVDMILTGAPNGRLVSFGAESGFTVRQLTLIGDSLAATVLLFIKFRQIPPRARSLLVLQTAWFLAGAWLASHRIHQVGATVLAYHAVWHLVAAFGFVIVWAFNHVRFVKQ